VKKIIRKIATAFAGAGPAAPGAAAPARRARFKKEKIQKPPAPVDYRDAEHLMLCDESRLDRRFLLPETTINFRDIGGYTGRDGRKLRWGLVFRAEALSNWDDGAIATLEAMGLRHVIDFRDTARANAQRDRLPATADYINLPVLGGIPVSARDIDFDDPGAIDRFFRSVYAYQVEHKASDFAQVLRLMTDPAAFPLLYHCTNGKDRTGFMTALILLICGVPETVILSDYTLSNLTFERAYESLGTVMATGLNMEAPEERAKLRDFFGVRPAWLASQLDFIREHFGDVGRYLTEQTDLAPADLAAIRANLLAPAGDVV
jgi:protein-tyrosine phosphatase